VTSADAPVGSLENGTGTENHIIPEPGLRYRSVSGHQAHQWIGPCCLPLCLVFSFGDRWYLLELKTEAQSHVCAQIEEIEKKNPEN
jgi:hypothetical protein